jgi:hypothetical protein
MILIEHYAANILWLALLAARHLYGLCDVRTLSIDAEHRRLHSETIPDIVSAQRLASHSFMRTQQCRQSSRQTGLARRGQSVQSTLL